jgi:hypothetical protein
MLFFSTAGYDQFGSELMISFIIQHHYSSNYVHFCSFVTVTSCRNDAHKIVIYQKANVVYEDR